jgi:hypothetical protein
MALRAGLVCHFVFRGAAIFALRLAHDCKTRSAHRGTKRSDCRQPAPLIVSGDVLQAAHSLQLLAENIPDKEDRYAPMKLADFLAKAAKLANDKARELGWIV